MADDKVIQSKNILERFSLEGKVALVTGGGQGDWPWICSRAC